jgi:hypothetical protein
MDDLDRMYRHLVRTLRATAPQLLTQPFQVGDLYTTILPYRLHRRELGLETNQDYEMAMLELLSGARGYLAVDDRMRNELGASLRTPNPDPALVRDHAQSRVALSPEALHALEMEGQPTSRTAELTIPIAPASTTASAREPDTAPFRAASAAPSATSPTSAAGGSTSAAPVTVPTSTAPIPPRAGGTSTGAAPAAPARRTPRPITVLPTGEQCRHCKGELPAGRQISFCPHCGQDLTVLHCPACGSELEHDWKFCVTCGRSTVGV